MKWLLAALTLLLTVSGVGSATGAAFSAVGFVGVLATAPLHHEGGLRGTVAGTELTMPVGPDALYGAVRVYACNPLRSDGQCSPTRQFDVLFGEPSVDLQTDDATVPVDLGSPYDVWRGDYTRRAQVYESWQDVPASIRAAGTVEPADGYQLKVLSIAAGEAVHVYGEGPDRRVVVGDASTEASTAERFAILGAARWSLGGVMVFLGLLTVVLWSLAGLSARRTRAAWAQAASPTRSR